MRKLSRKIWSSFTTIALVAGFTISSPTFSLGAPIQVSVFSFPGLTEGNGACADEVDNLEEIISKLGYSVDRTITSLADSGGQTLLARLNASQFFFVPDMESSFTVSNTSDFPASAVTAFQTWLNNGGVFVMTGTYGSKDIDFINKVTGWSLSSATVGSTSRNDANVSGTPFDGSSNNVTLGNPSATDGINGSSAPGSANFKPLWGTTSAASVATMDYGAGKIIFLGWDFYNSGYSGVNNYNSSVCGETSNSWATKIIPAALEYASQLSGASALTNLTTAGGDLGYTVSQNGTAYLAVVASGSTAPTAAQVKAATNYTGATVLYSANASVTANISRTFTISGLSSASDYVAYVVTEYGSPAQYSTITSTSFSTKPGTPKVSSLTAGNSQVSVAINSASNETNFQYSIDGGTNWVTRSPAAVTSPWTISGLNNGTSYSFQFRSVYKGQTGSSTSLFSATPSGTVATAPTINSVSASSTSLSVVFTAPSDNGGYSITNYKYSTDGVNYVAFSPAQTTSPLNIQNLSIDGTSPLVDGSTYQISIKAVNASGDSTASNYENATPSSAPKVTSPNQPTFALSTNNQDPGNFSISGFSSSATLNVSIGFVDPPSGVTFALPSTTGLTAGYGYDFTGGKTQISFTGSMANANQALADLTVSTGSNAGTITIRVTVYENQTDLYYNPINGHYYKVISRANTFANSATASSSAIHLAESAELFGLKGYLATITTSQEQKFIYDNINGSNIWIGASDDKELLNERAATSFADQTSAEGKWYWVTGPEAGTQFWQGATSSGLWINSSTSATQSRTSANISTSRYENWCTGNASPYTLTDGRSIGEPNNAGSGEHYILEKWNNATCWNDYGVKDGSAQSYYLVEFSENWGSGNSGWNQARGTFTSTVNNPIATASVSALADNSPRSVAATAGLNSAVITWLAPLSGTVTSYTVTSNPGSLTCTTSSLTCTVTGLTAGTSYTFTVTATFNDSSTKNSLASAAITPTGTNANSGGGTGGGSSSATPTPSSSPVPTNRTTSPIVRNTPLLSGPVNTGTNVNQIGKTPQTLIGGVQTNTTTRVVDQSKLNILAGALNLEIQVPQNVGSVTNNGGTTQLQVQKGGITTINGSGLRPLSTVQVFLPLQGNNSRELARIPVTSSGTFNGLATFANPTQGAPLPIGQQVLQIVSIDPAGRQTVVEMKVNISQPAPAPEQNRQAGQLPDLNPGQSIATEAGLPVPVIVEAIEQQRQAIIQGDTWQMSINVPNANGEVTQTDGSALLKFIQNESVFVEGDGFLPGTRADVWLFSDPTLLGTVEIDANGEFSGQIAVDGKFVPTGEHTLQIQGVGDDGFVRSANLGVVVEANTISATSLLNSTWFYALLGVGLVAITTIFALARRRRKEAKHA